jgi:autotransporter-associated beta strand protein
VGRHAAACAAAGADRCRRPAGLLRQRRRQRLHRVPGRHGAPARPRTRIYEGSLAKFGAGALTLSGNNSFTGGTELHGGSLVAASAHAFGTGDVDVFGGKLATRSADTVAIGGDLKLGSGSILDLGLGPGGHTLLLDVDGRMTFGGLLTITFLDGFLGLGLYDLFDFGSFEGAFSGYTYDGLWSGYTASLIFGANGVDLNIAAVPEPETYAMLLAGLGVLGWAARRRKRELHGAHSSDDAATAPR